MHITYKWFLDLSLKFVSFFSYTYKLYVFSLPCNTFDKRKFKGRITSIREYYQAEFQFKNKTYGSTLYYSGMNIKNTKYEKEFIQCLYAKSKCTNKIVFVLWKFESQCFLIDSPFSCLFVFSHAFLDIFKLTKKSLNETNK